MMETPSTGLPQFGNEGDIQRLAELNGFLAELLIPNDVVLGIYLVAGLFGNLLVIYVYAFKLKSKRDNRFFIPFLAIFDLFACGIGDAFALGLNVLPITFRGDVLCKTLWYLSEVTTISSSLLLLVIGLQRYIKVCRPFELQMTSIWKKVALVVTVVSAGLMSGPSVLFYGEIRVPTAANVTGFRCGIRNNRPWLVKGFLVYNSILFGSAVVGIGTMAVMYGIIARVIYHQFLRHKNHKVSRKTSHQMTQKSSRDDSNISYEAKVMMRKDYETQCSTSPSTEVHTSNSSLPTPETDMESQPPFPETDMKSQPPVSETVLESRPPFRETDVEIESQPPYAQTDMGSQPPIPETNMKSPPQFAGLESRQTYSEKDTESQQPQTNIRDACANTSEMSTGVQLRKKVVHDEDRRTKRWSFDVLRENIVNIREKLHREKVYNHFRVHRCTYMFMTITLIFVVSYIPRVVLMLIESINPRFWHALPDEQIQACLFLYRMYLLNHVTNPFIYGLFDSRFRSKAKRILCPCFLKR